MILAEGSLAHKHALVQWVMEHGPDVIAELACFRGDEDRSRRRDHDKRFLMNEVETLTADRDKWRDRAGYAESQLESSG